MTFDQVLEAADRFIAASKRVETSLPREMSASVAILETARIEMERALSLYGRSLPQDVAKAGGGGPKP